MSSSLGDHKADARKDIADVFQVYQELWDMIVTFLAEAQACRQGEDIFGERRALELACNSTAIALQYHVPPAVAAQPEWSALLGSYQAQAGAKALVKLGESVVPSTPTNLIEMHRTWMVRVSDLSITSVATVDRKKNSSAMQSKPWYASLVRMVSTRCTTGKDSFVCVQASSASLQDSHLIQALKSFVPPDVQIVRITKGHAEDIVSDRCLFVLDCRHPPNAGGCTDAMVQEWKWHAAKASAQSIVMCIIAEQCKCCSGRLSSFLGAAYSSPLVIPSLASTSASASASTPLSASDAQSRAHAMIAKFCQQPTSAETQLVSKYVLPVCNILCDCLAASGQATTATLDRVIMDWIVRSCDRPLDTQRLSASEPVSLSLVPKWSPGISLICSPLLRHFITGMEPDAKQPHTNILVSGRILGAIGSTSEVVTVEFAASVAGNTWPTPWSVLQDYLRRPSASSSMMAALNEAQLKILLDNLTEMRVLLFVGGSALQLQNTQAFLEELYYAWIEASPHMTFKNLTRTSGAVVLGGKTPIHCTQVSVALNDKCNGCLATAACAVPSEPFSPLQLSLLDAMHICDQLMQQRIAAPSVTASQAAASLPLFLAEAMRSGSVF